MKYKLIGSNDYLINPVEVILNNRGIKDVHRFLNVNESYTHDWILLRNIEKAADCLLYHLNNENKIYVQVDSDFDGAASSTILINYIKHLFPKSNIAWRVHEDKNHGVVLKDVPNDTKLVIIPDAGSNQYKEHQKLKEKGMDVIVLDHHLCERESEYAIVVNNQLSPEYPNKNFSGCGIVYKFCKALDHKLGVQHADYFLDLVAVGNIADSMDLRELETRYYVLKGLKQINNPLLKELFKKQEFSTKGIVNIITVGFYIAPLVNATIRVGNTTERVDMMKAFLESKEHIYNTKKAESEPIATAMARIMSNVRARQNRLRDKGLALIEERIQEKELDKNKILIVNVTDILEKSLSGLVANQLTNRYKRPCLLIRQHNGDVFGGSGRGYDKHEIKDFRQFLINTDKFIFCEGHPGAFGLNIHKDNLVEVNDILNKQLEHIELEDVYEVDFAIPANQLNENIIKQITQMRDVWGNTVGEPLLVINDVSVNTSDIDNGQKKNVLKFTYKGIDFIKFKASEDEYEAMMKGENVTLDLVVKCSVNEYNGVVKQQLVIEDYNVVKLSMKKEFVF